MPVHAREKKESNHEEMEVDYPEQDGSSTDEEDTVSSSVSEDGDSSGRKTTTTGLNKHQHALSMLHWLCCWKWADMLTRECRWYSVVDEELSCPPVNRDGWWGLWEEEGGVSGWDDHAGETVHWPEGAVSSKVPFLPAPHCCWTQ